jgi:hypothetical protein
VIPAEFHGAWVRHGISVGGASDSEDMIVWWLQAPSLHADLRTPMTGDGEVICFAGTTSWDGHALTWTHDLDLAPSGTADVGTVAWDGADLLESGSCEQDGRAVPYTERWRRLPGGGPLWALRSATGRIVRAGKYALTVVDGRESGAEFTATAWLLEGDRWEVHRAWPKGAQQAQPPYSLDDLPAGWTIDESVP